MLYANSWMDTADVNKLMQRVVQTGFEENKGQVKGGDAERVRYVMKAGNLSLFLLNDGISYQFSKIHYPDGYAPSDKSPFFQSLQKNEIFTNINTETYRMDLILIGANPNPKITTEGKSIDYIQYYNMNIINVFNYSKVIYHDIYPDIDWIIYRKDGYVKYDFAIHPGGNPSEIKLKTNWVEDLYQNKDGSLVLRNKMGSITENKPVSFQDDKRIPTRFNLDAGVISFKLQAPYNKTQLLIIDPVLEWTSYKGGSEFDVARACATDNSNNVYLTGYTNSANNIADGGYQNTIGGSAGISDAFLMKFNSNGTRVWSTYYGGRSIDDGFSCATDPWNNVYLTGSTGSDTAISSDNSFQDTLGGNYAGFLVKFNSSGIRQWATYYPGVGQSCATDTLGNIYMAGGINTTNGLDAFLAKFDSSGIRLWSSNFGGDSSNGLSCATDILGNVYLTGTTSALNNIAQNGHQLIYGGGAEDAFLVKFNENGVQQWSTYYGGSFRDYGNACATDVFGNIYLSGGTYSINNIAFNAHQNTMGGYYDNFLVKFNGNGIRQWGTYYGGLNGDLPGYCATDDSGNVYLVGTTASSNNIASNDYQDTIGVVMPAAFLVRFNSNGERQWGTYYEFNNMGDNYHYGNYCALDNSGAIYIAGQTGYEQIMDVYLAKFNQGVINVGIPDIKKETIIIYPNPARDVLNIFLDKQDDISIYSVTGQFMQKLASSKHYIIDVSSYLPGMYFVKSQNMISKFIKL